MHKVLFVSTSFPADSADWRGTFVRDLVQALAACEDLQLHSWMPPGELPENVADFTTDADRRYLRKLMAAGGIANLLRQSPLQAPSWVLKLLGSQRAMYKRAKGFDLHHVNWLQNSLMIPDDGVPLLASVLGTDMRLLKLPGMVGMLRRVFKRRRTIIAPNAHWMEQPLRDRFADCATVTPIPFGIDKRWFEIERSLERGKQRWLCVSRLTAAKLGTLFEWGADPFANPARELHLFGPMQETTAVPDWVHYHGPATPVELREKWFPQAHGLISLSRHAEGRPQVMLEAMAAGLPVIASHLPAHNDIIEHRQSGWICAQQADLEAALVELEPERSNRKAGAKAKAWAESAVGRWSDCAQRYRHAYAQLYRRQR